MVYAQSLSPWPTITPWPTATYYPTASPTPTASPWPTITLGPTKLFPQQNQILVPSSGQRTQSIHLLNNDIPLNRVMSLPPSETYPPSNMQMPFATPTSTTSPWPTIGVRASSLQQAHSAAAATPPTIDITTTATSTTLRPSSILDVMVDNFIEAGISNRPAPTTSPLPSITPFPTMTRYPTASPTPTTSPFPTRSHYPSASPTPTISPFPSISEPQGTHDDNLSSSPTFIVTTTRYPTASPTPTASPFPSISEQQGINDDNLISVSPTLIVTTTRYPTASPTPTASPFPTLFEQDTDTDNASVNPTMIVTTTRYPTASPTPTASPFPTIFEQEIDTDNASVSPTMIVTTTRYPTASPTPTASPFPTIFEQEQEFTNANRSPMISSSGYGQTCDNFNMTSDKIEEAVIFTYQAESTTTSPTFLSELEVHLLDRAVAEALDCSSLSGTDSGGSTTPTTTSTNPVRIYRIRYPESEIASEATTCKPVHHQSKSCWILQTKMFVTTDRSTRIAARRIVLQEIQARLNNGNLMTSTFPDLTFTKYLGPDILGGETPVLETTAPTTNQGSHQKSNVFTYAMVSVGLFITSLFCCVACMSYSLQTKHREDVMSIVHDPSIDESEGSVEIIELLSRSRKRLKDGPLPSSTSSDPLHVEVYQDEESSSEFDSEFDTGYHAENDDEARDHHDHRAFHITNGSSRSTKSSSAAGRYYRKARASSSSAAASLAMTSPRRESFTSSREFNVDLSAGSRANIGSRNSSSRSRSSDPRREKSNTNQGSSSSSRKSRSPKPPSLFDDPIRQQQPQERQAFEKGNSRYKSNTMSQQQHVVDQMGDSTLV